VDAGVDAGGGVRYRILRAKEWYACGLCGMDIVPDEWYVAEVLRGRWRSRIRARYHIYCFNRASKVGYVVVLTSEGRTPGYRFCREEELHSEQGTAQ
jgi:hypothetical protein